MKNFNLPHINKLENPLFFNVSTSGTVNITEIEVKIYLKLCLNVVLSNFLARCEAKIIICYEVNKNLFLTLYFVTLKLAFAYEIYKTKK